MTTSNDTKSRQPTQVRHLLLIDRTSSEPRGRAHRSCCSGAPAFGSAKRSLSGQVRLVERVGLWIPRNVPRNA